MSRTYAVIIDQKGALQDFQNLPASLQEAARIAVNNAADKARTRSANAVLGQVNFPAQYVSPSQGRLSVSNRATNASLSATISAQSRATSLARFAKGKPKPYARNGATVEVKPGVARYIKGAVFVKLNQGAGQTDTKYNLGLAVRTKGNARPSSAYKPVQMRNGMWLLYGPSVAQALLSARETGVWPSMTDEIMDNLQREYLRQLDLRDV